MTAYFFYLCNEMPELAFVYISSFCFVWGTLAMYTIAWVNKEHSTMARGNPEKEPLWLILLSILIAVSATVCFLWRMVGVGDASGYTLTTGMPGVDWCAALMVVCTSQCVISASLAQAWRNMWLLDAPVARAIGTLPALLGTLQLIASGLALCRVIPSNVASWWIPILLGGSALEEVLIAVSCFLLVYKAQFSASRRDLFLFAIFIAAGCMGGISLAIAMIVCRVKSASHAWDILSMVSPLYRVTFLFAHLTYQRYVMFRSNHVAASSNAAVNRALPASSSSSQSSWTLGHVEGLVVEMTRTREQPLPRPRPPAAVKTASSSESPTQRKHK